MTQIPVVGMMGSDSERHEDLSFPLWTWLAEQGFHMLAGGGAGVMDSVGEAFASVEGCEGLVIGVPPAGRNGYPNPWLELPIRTHLRLSGDRG